MACKSGKCRPVPVLPVLPKGADAKGMKIMPKPKPPRPIDDR